MDQDRHRQMLERATALIDGAGGGDWNREEASWQLAAAAWKRDLENLDTRPDRFVLEDDLTPMQAALQAMGAASMCWENPGGAGVFDADRASRVAKELVSWLRRHPADETKDLVARAWHLLRRVPEGMVLPPWEQEMYQLGVDIARQGWFPTSPDPAQERLPVEDTARWPAEYTAEGGPVSPARIQAFVADDADTAVDAEVVDEPKRPMLPAAYPAGRIGGRSTTDYPTAPGSPDLGDDPDGDLDGYDGPPPGMWCAYNGANPHVMGSRPGCVGCQEKAAQPG